MIYDLAIVGGGPAGVAAGVYAARKQLKTVFITKDFDGQSAVSMDVQNWIGTVSLTGGELAKNLENHLRAYAGKFIDIKTSEWVKQIEKAGKDFSIKTDKNNYSARAILVTAGSSRKKLEAKGAKEFDNKGLTYCASCDGPLFSDMDVAVIGAGNAAFDTAAQLLAYCKSVTLLAHHDFKADSVTIEKTLANPKFKAFKNTEILEIKGDKFVSGIIYKNRETEEKTEFKVKGIFVEIGSIPNTDFVKNLVKLDKWNHIVVDPKNQTASEKGVWAAGDCTDGLYHQNNIAAGDAVKALEDIYLLLHKLSPSHVQNKIPTD